MKFPSRETAILLSYLVKEHPLSELYVYNCLVQDFDFNDQAAKDLILGLKEGQLNCLFPAE